MSIKEGLTCKECRIGHIYKKDVSEEFERDGLKFHVEGIPAFVCDHCGETYFPPGALTHVTRAANELVALSKISQAKKSKVSVAKRRSVAAGAKSISCSKRASLTK